MTGHIENNVERSLKAAEELYHRLVLVVGTSGSGKTSVMQNLAELHEVELVNVNLRLSIALLEVSEKHRQLRLSDILAQTVNGNGDVVFLDNTEIFFDVNLKQNPLLLLQNLSRNLTVVSSWNGTFEQGKLTYAEPGHREYRSYTLTDTLVVTMSGEATIDANRTKEK